MLRAALFVRYCTQSEDERKSSMTSSIGASVFYLASILACFTGFLTVKKTGEKLDFFVWLPVSILSVMCANVFAAAVISLFGIPVNLVSVGAIDAVLAALLWGRVIRSGQRQAYSVSVWAAVCCGVVALLTVLLALRQFGPDLTIHYCTMDPGVHLSFAMDIVNSQQIEGMFFAQLHNALFIELLSPFVSQIWYYKLFILSDVGMLALSGWMFTALIHSRCKTRFLKGAGAVVTVLYLLGYPLNNLEYGFIYLGLGVTVCCFLLFVTDRLLAGEIAPKLNLLLILLGCFGVFACYILFAPAVWAAVFLLLALSFHRAGVLFRRRGIGTLAAVFVPPGVLAVIWYCFHWYTQTAPSTVIASEGFIFQDLFASFVPFLPFALYGLIQSFRKKAFRASSSLTCVLAVFLIAMFVLGMFGKVSAYYYFKSYYLLWMAVFDLLLCGLSWAAEKSKGMILCYSCVWALVGGMAFSGADQAVHTYKPYFNPEPAAGAFFRIYRFNAQNPSWDPMDPGALELFQHVLTEYRGETVPLVGTQEQFDWYEGISNQRLDDYQFWKLEPEEAIRRISRCDYAVVLYNNDLYRYSPEYWNSFERLYENSSGFVAKLSAG